MKVGRIVDAVEFDLSLRDFMYIVMMCLYEDQYRMWFYDVYYREYCDECVGIRGDEEGTRKGFVKWMYYNVWCRRRFSGDVVGVMKRCYDRFVMNKDVVE